MALAPWAPFSVAAMAGVLHNLGDPGGAQELLAQFPPDVVYRAPIARFGWAMMVGDVEQAVAAAIQAVEQRFTSAPNFVMMFAPRLRQSPNWPALRKALHLPETSP